MSQRSVARFEALTKIVVASIVCTQREDGGRRGGGRHKAGDEKRARERDQAPSQADSAAAKAGPSPVQ